MIADSKSDNPVLKAFEYKFARFGQIVICPCAAGSPFGDKHGQALVHRGGNAVAQPLTVRACVKMTGVHQIRAGNRVICRVENILTPSARADEDDALRGVRADGLYHGLGVGLDVAASSNVRKKGS